MQNIGLMMTKMCVETCNSIFDNQFPLRHVHDNL